MSFHTRNHFNCKWFKLTLQDFSGGTLGRNLPANAGDTGLIPGLERFHMLQSG